MGQKQQVNLLNRNIKNKTKQINRITSGNIVAFNQLGKSTATYATERITGWKKGVPIFVRDEFKLTGASKTLEKLNKTTPGKMGKALAKYLNVTEAYKDLVKGMKSGGGTGLPLHPEILDKNAKSTRIAPHVEGAKTPAELVATGNQEAIERAGSHRGKYAKEVRQELQNATTSAKGKSAEQLKELQGKIGEARGKKIRSALSGVSNVFGSFMSGLKSN